MALIPGAQIEFNQIATTRGQDMDTPWCWDYSPAMLELAAAGLIVNCIGPHEKGSPLQREPRQNVWMLTDLGKTLAIFIVEGVVAA